MLKKLCGNPYVIGINVFKTKKVRYAYNTNQYLLQDAYFMHTIINNGKKGSMIVYGDNYSFPFPFSKRFYIIAL